jgi:DNA-binding GntR family transcriptional regulator
MLQRGTASGRGARDGVGESRLDPLAPLNLATQVADRLVEGIADGRLKSGQRLIESELAADLGISLIAFDAAWQQQLYEMRVALERVSWRHAAAAYRREPARLARFDTLVERMRGAVEAADRQAVNRMDIAIHEALCEESASPLLMTLWRAIRRHVLIVFAQETADAADLGAILDQHVRLRALLRTGNEQKLERELQDHVLGHLSLQRRSREARATGAAFTEQG